MVSVRKSDTNSRISVKSTKETNVFGIKDNLSEYYAKQAENWAHSEVMVNGTDYSSRYYAEQSKASAQVSESIKTEIQGLVEGFDNTVQVAQDNLKQSRLDSIDAINNTYSVAIGDMQEKSDEALTNIEYTKSTAINDIEFVADGEKQEIQSLVDDEKEEIKDLANLIKENAQDIASRTSFAMFDTVLKDHILTYEESKGLALQGTWVYKTAVAGERYGYPDFYNKCVEEFENSANEQAYLKSNVTYVGSVVDNQGVLSGFSSSNYATLPNYFAPASNSWEFVTKITTGNLSTDNMIIGSTTAFKCGLAVFLQDTGLFCARLSSNGTSWDIGQFTGSTLSANTEYWIKVEFTGEAYNVYYCTDGASWILDITISSTTPIYQGSYYWLLGAGVVGGTTGYYNTANLNLNESYININGSRWWTGTDTVTKNPNGHLFYDISQKDQVDEVFASTGLAWFYGIDAENERIFLPRNNYFEQATGDVSEVGQSIEAGLPNITGSGLRGGQDGTGGGAFVEVASGQSNGASGNYGANYSFDASRSNSIYGNSDTVQPNAVKKLLYICVGNTVADTSWVDVVTQVQGGVKDIENARESSLATIEKTTISCVDEVEMRGAELRSKMALSMFDTILKDHILTYEESKGLALQGTYVYKDAVAGSRYGYAGFYNKCLQEFENSEYEKIDFEQPVLSANGTLGGDSFAVSASIEHDSGANIYYAYRCFASNANTSETTSWLALATTASYTIYNPKALNITNIQITNRMSYPRAVGSGMVLGSNDNDTWEEITSFTNTNNNTSVVWNIDLSNNKKSYKYYKLDNLTGIDGEWISIGKINITATYNGVFKANVNGHIFYDITDKNQIDELFNQTGMAWFYGIDQENERVFLPRNVWFEQMSMDDVGKAIEAGVPNITGSLSPRCDFDSATGAFYRTSGKGLGHNSSYSGYSTALFDASRSSSVYGKSDTVQPNAVKKLLYICVGNTEATSTVTDVVEVTTTENDTLPLLHHIPADELLEHPSWLRSGGQWNDGNVYTTAYNYLVNEYMYGTEHTDTLTSSDGTEYTVTYKTIKGKKVVDVANVNQVDVIYSAMGSAWYYVINQDDMTFRLPMSHNSECYTSDPTRVGLDVSAGLPNIEGAINGIRPVKGAGNMTLTGAFREAALNAYIPSGASVSNQFDGVVFDASLSNPIYGNSDTVTPPHTEFYLYFKVANAVQNLELLNAGEVLEAVNNLVPNNSSLISGYAMPSDRYVDLTLGASGTTYTAPANGWYVLVKSTTGAGQHINLTNTTTSVECQGISHANSQNIPVAIPARKGDVVMVQYAGTGSVRRFKFIYVEGEQ